MKFISHLLILALGAALGVWWGVNHPTEAEKLAAHEQAAVSEAKIDLIQKFMGHGSPDDKNSADYQQMLKDEQQKLQDAKSKLGELNKRRFVLRQGSKRVVDAELFHICGFTVVSGGLIGPECLRNFRFKLETEFADTN